MYFRLRMNKSKRTRSGDDSENSAGQRAVRGVGSALSLRFRHVSLPITLSASYKMTNEV